MVNSKTIFKLWNLIPKEQKKSTPLLIGLIFFGMLLEVFGLGALFPIVTGLLDVNSVRSFIAQRLDFLLPYINNFSDDMFIYAGLGVLVLLYMIKSGFLIFLSYFQNDYLIKVVRDNSNNLFSSYFDQDYIYFTKKNSSDIIKIFQLEIYYLMSYLTSFFFVITELCMAVAIVITLFVVEPAGALMVALFFSGVSLIFYSSFKKKIANYGERRELIQKEMTKNILESFQSVKEIKLYGNFSYFKKVHQSNNAIKAKIMRNQLVIGQLPRLFLEVVAVIGLAIFIISLLFQGFGTTQLISILTLFVAASFRMVPSLNRVLNGVQNMRFIQASINVIHDEYTSFSQKKDEIRGTNRSCKPKNHIRFENISFAYQSKNILNNISLEIPVGDTIGIIGRSGQGKTTLLDVIIGLLIPQEGQLYIDNQKLLSKDYKQWQENIGYVSQLISLSDNTIKKNIAFGIDDKSISSDKLNRCIEKAQLSEFIDSLENGINTEVGERGIQLSGGQRQRIGIARALYHNPEILVFDEATSALDEETEDNFMSAIENFKGDKTIIIVTHRLSTLRFCDTIYELEGGKLTRYKQ